VISWNQKHGRVSEAFDEWKLIDRDQRTFLRLGLEFATLEYDRLWKESGEEPYEEDGPDQLDSFEEKVGGLYQQDFDWMHLAGVLRDAVTSFEVYLEKAREEVLRHDGQAVPVDARSPTWRQLRVFFCQLGVQVATAEVELVRGLRHFLTHRRGELRTEDLRKTFQETHPDLFPPLAVELTEERVIESMNVLAEAVRAVDSVVYEYTWGGARRADLRP
jgi:hypothetical protein